MLHVHLFGGLALFSDDEPLASIPSAAARSLLAYLVAYRDRPHTRDMLAGTFWPDLPDDVARRRLRQALWHIRRALPNYEVLLTEGDTVQLNPDLPLQSDFEQFSAHCAQCAAGTPKALEHGEACVELYQGDFLAGYYDDWALAEREQLRETFLAVLTQLIEAYKAKAAYERALVHARRLAGEDPWREEAHCEVMRLCHLLGRDKQALQAYEACRRALAEELGVEPSPATVALAEEIAARAESVELPHLPTAPRPSPLALLARPDQLPLVGREVERAELVRHLELALAGSGGLVFLVGEAGVGKTRLAQEVARDAAWRGMRVVWGHSCELCAPPPYQPLVEVLYDADLTHLSAIWRHELAGLIPVLGEEPAEPSPVLDSEQARGRLLEALTRAFVALGEASPHLVILEDLQWMDPASFEVLRILLPRLSTAHLLVVGTVRHEELAVQPAVAQAVATLEATRIPRRLKLAPLTAAQTEALIQQVLDLDRAARRLSQRLYDGTEGNPFFLTETLRALVDEGLLYRDDGGRWRTSWDEAMQDFAKVPVPPSVAQSIEGRLARLPSSVQELLGVAAVIGRRVPFELWLAVSKRDDETLLAAAGELTQRALLVETDDGLGYRFAHDIFRHVVYEGVSAVRRRQWHRQVGTALELLHPDQVDALAMHFRLAQAWPQAVRYARQAGERAQAVYASQQALDHYHRADVWLAEGRVEWPADEIACWRADLAEQQGRIHRLLGKYEAADAAFTRAWRTWTALGDWRSAVRVLNRLSFLYLQQDDFAKASQYAQGALAALPETDRPADLWAISLTDLGLSAWGRGDYAAAQRALEEALTLFEEQGADLYHLARCLNSLGQVHLAQRDLVAADRRFARSLALRQQIGDRQGEAWCCLNQGRAALARGDLDAARERLSTARAIFAEIQHRFGLDTCAQVLAEVEEAKKAAQEIRQIEVRLACADAPTGRPLRDDEYVTVTWTVTTAGDQAIPGKRARRQHRLLRLLNEAEDQGAAPTVEDLGAALDVSQPTIKRDLSALRRAGHKVHTRGSRAQ